MRGVEGGGGDAGRERMREMWPLTSAINKVGLGLGGGRREQFIVILVGAEGAGVVPLACVHDGVGHHDVAQRVVQVAVQQAALVLGRRHVVVSQGGSLGGRAQAGTHAHGHAHHGGALLLDHTLVHGLVALLGAALRPLRVVPICNSKKRKEKKTTEKIIRTIRRNTFPNYFHLSGPFFPCVNEKVTYTCEIV